VAQLYTLANAIEEAIRAERNGKPAASIGRVMVLMVQMLAPMIPHLAEECWRVLGMDGLVAESGWPKPDPALVAEDELVLPVQVNGKKRCDITVSADASEDDIVAATLALDVVRKALDGARPRKVIVVPRRIINVVI
jgi:leucyl-tRNA synthetase